MFGNNFVGLLNTTSLTFNKISSRVFYLTIVDLFLLIFFQMLLQKWMAFTNLRVDNFTITDSLVFTNTNSLTPQDNYAFCKVRINYVMLVILYKSLLSWKAVSCNKSFSFKWMLCWLGNKPVLSLATESIYAVPKSSILFCDFPHFHFRWSSSWGEVSLIDFKVDRARYIIICQTLAICLFIPTKTPFL